jgi:peptidoglycan/LPS O-acetylase OafA/YrhL
MINSLQTNSSLPDVNTKRPRLDYLDGFRGLSAVIIATYHAQLFTGYGISTSSLPPYFRFLSTLISYGHLAVPVFIVISGYSLTIPVALNPDKKLKGGFGAYIKRRAKRILPPYYFALALFIILIYAVPLLNIKQNTAWDSKIPLDFPSIASHILLIHNFNTEWISKIDGPLWSVATEWQIYFLLPVLIFLWKKFNLLTSVTIAVLVGIAVSAVFIPARTMNFWFVGLFALGMLGAVINFSKEQFWINISKTVPWKLVIYAGTFMLILLLVVSKFKNISPLILDTLVGSYVAVLLTGFTFIEMNELKRPWFLNILNFRVCMNLGLFSYSIYLIHSPFLALINLLTLHVPFSNASRLMFMEIVAVPVAILISYIFYILVEKRFQATIVKKTAGQVVEEIK